MKEIMATDLVRAKTVSNQCKLSFPAAVHTFSPYRGVFDGAFPLTVSRVLRAAKYTNIYIGSLFGPSISEGFCQKQTIHQSFYS